MCDIDLIVLKPGFGSMVDGLACAKLLFLSTV